MQVRDLMTPAVVSVQPQDSVAVARQRLKAHRIRHLLVMNDGSAVGLVRHVDVAGRRDSRTVASVMSHDVVTVSPDETIQNAAALMLGRSHGFVAVVENGTVIGVLTTTDLRRAVTTYATSTA